MKARYSPKEMEKLLSECGFIVDEHLGSEEMTKMYFDEYNKSMPEHLIVAPVGV